MSVLIFTFCSSLSGTAGLKAVFFRDAAGFFRLAGAGDEIGP